MAAGGKREGAGRKHGAISKKTAELVAAVEAGGETPLDYMLRVMRETEAESTRRDDMAKAAAPYVHAKLSQVDANAKLNLDGSITFTWQPPQES